MWITTKCGKLLKRSEYQTTLPAFWETCMQVRKQELEPDMEQCTGFKLGKEYIKSVYCHPAYVTCTQSSHCSVARSCLTVTPWTAAHQASLSFTISQSLLKLMYIESMMPSTISSLVIPFSSCLQSVPTSGPFPVSQLFISGGQVLELQLQHQSFQWISCEMSAWMKHKLESRLPGEISITSDMQMTSP